MNSIILHMENWCQSDWEKVFGHGRLYRDEFIIQNQDGWIQIYQDADILDHYELEEIEQVYSLIKKPTIFILEWRNDDLLYDFLQRLPDSIKVVVDNDTGIIADLSVLKRIAIQCWIREKEININ